MARKRTLVFRALVGAVALLVPLLTHPTAAASAATASLRVRAVAGLLADGAGVAIRLLVTCDAVDLGFANATAGVSQSVSPELVVHGSGNQELQCDGTEQEIRVLARSTENVHAFTSGTAFVQAGVTICEREGVCATDEVKRTVDIEPRWFDKRVTDEGWVQVRLPATGRLEAQGAAATLRYHYACQGPEYTIIYTTITLLQVRADRSITQTYAYGDPTCDGQSRTDRVSLVSPGAPWLAGPALLVVTVELCDEISCTRDDTWRAIELGVA